MNFCGRLKTAFCGLVLVTLFVVGTVPAMADASNGSFLYSASSGSQFNTLVLYMQGGGVQVVSNLQGAFNVCDSQCFPDGVTLNFGDPIGNQGWWSPNSSTANTSGNPNYVAGVGGGEKYRDFFSFDLSGVAGTVVGAALELQRFFGNTTNPPYVGYNIGSISSNITVADLNNKGDHSGTRDQDMFDALGNSDYGKFQVDPITGADPNDILHFALSGIAVTDLNSILGGALDPSGRKWMNIAGSTYDVSPTDGSQDPTVLASRTQPMPPTSVPEPASLMLLGAGFGYLGLKRRK